VSNIGFRHLLKQVPIQEYTKRSDIMITSTLSMSLYPRDRRKMRNFFQVKKTENELIDYIDERAAFNAMCKENNYENGTVREKDKEFKETYMKSFIHRSEFKSEKLTQFKKKVERLNRNGI
jgi:hypothetical protein